MPESYVLESLARRWNVPPWAVTEAMADPSRRGDVFRALEFMRLEASVRSGRS